jgi:hypothetical protein
LLQPVDSCLFFFFFSYTLENLFWGVESDGVYTWLLRLDFFFYFTHSTINSLSFSLFLLSAYHHNGEYKEANRKKKKKKKKKGLLGMRKINGFFFLDITIMISTHSRCFSFVFYLYRCWVFLDYFLFSGFSGLGCYVGVTLVV